MARGHTVSLRSTCMFLLCGQFTIRGLSAITRHASPLAYVFPHSRLVYHTMPKAKEPVFPVSALFGVAKPSGPTSMHVVNEIKTLIHKSKIFMDESKIEDSTQKKKGGKRKRREKSGLKIGQGGTLDPLADGVLGKCTLLPMGGSAHLLTGHLSSHWRRPGDETSQRFS